MEVVMVSLLSINDIKMKMDVSMQNGSMLFYLFLGELKKFRKLVFSVRPKWMKHEC